MVSRVLSFHIFILKRLPGFYGNGGTLLGGGVWALPELRALPAPLSLSCSRHERRGLCSVGSTMEQPSASHRG